ncbi:MAG: HEPN domain-containing protein [Acidimicrobiales bacterium]
MSAKTSPGGLPEARAHLRKARQHLSAAKRSAKAKEYDAAVGLAATAGVNAGDAVSLWSQGRRSASPSHRAAIGLLRTNMVGSQMAGDLANLLGAKNIAHYGDAEMSGEDARRAIDAAERMVQKAMVAVTPGALGPPRAGAPARPRSTQLVDRLRGHPDGSKTPGPGRQPCGAWMPVARKHCVLRPGHHGPHRSR